MLRLSWKQKMARRWSHSISVRRGIPTPEASRMMKPGKTRKSPSDVARSRRRREAWLKAKESAVPEISTQHTAAEPGLSFPSPVGGIRYLIFLS
jgi:hypothetical protein